MAKNAYKNWRLERDDDDIAWLYADRHEASTNALSAPVLAEFETILQELSDQRPRGLVIRSAKQGGFIAGADINEFTQMESATQATELIGRAHTIFNRLESLRVPSVALIEGYCLGGGFELALACRYRIAVDQPSTRFGFPEILLGIHPGFGGTVRSIRHAGAVAAFDLMLTGRTIDPRRAQSLGLIDKRVPPRQAASAARALIEKQPPVHRAKQLDRIADAGLARPLIGKYLRREVAKRAHPKHYPAPYALIDLWVRHGGDPKQMLREEIDSIARLITSDTARNLVRVFFLQERLKSQGRGAAFQAQHVHVVGAGLMGGDIAAWCAYKGIQVTLQDREPRFIAPALQRAQRLFARRIHDRRLRAAAMDRLRGDHSGTGVGRADVVIEAIIENAEAKQALYREIEPRLRDGALLATNTSSIPLETLGQSLASPERLVGLHFFNPVAKMQLVEIISTASTAPDSVAKAAAFTRAIDRLPLPVRSSPGFLVNRILTPYMLEAVCLFAEGVSMDAIDKAATNFGMPMGPIELADTVGLDICLSVGEVLGAELGMEVPDLLRRKVAAGDLGRKTGRGFYEYHKGKRRSAAAEQDDDATSAADIQDRLVLKIVNESVACLREEVVADADLLDAGMIFGTGFAPFRGGPMHHLERVGANELNARLLNLEQRYGSRFAADAGWQKFER